MHDSTQATEVQFPWLPGETHVTPDPTYAYRDDALPPHHLMVTLQQLSHGADPDAHPPIEWVNAVDPDTLNAPIRAIAEHALGLFTIWDDLGQSYNWFKKTKSGARKPVSSVTALRRCWQGYARMLITELSARNETPKQALQRISFEWGRWREARAGSFIAKWRDVASWPPTLALSWIMFWGDWHAIASYLNNGRELQSSSIFLASINSWCDLVLGDCGIRRPDAANLLLQSLRLRINHERRVIARGMLNGVGRHVEIDPTDLLNLDWAFDPPQRAGAVLESSCADASFYTNVLIDAESLVAVFPPRAMVAPAAKRVGRRASAQEKIVEAEKAERLAGRDPSDLTIEALAETADVSDSSVKRHRRRKKSADQFDPI